MLKKLNLFKPFGLLVITLLLLCRASGLLAQCPPNADFEDGTFNGWTLSIGNVEEVNGTNVISLATVASPEDNRHEIIPNVPGNTDFFGGFPKHSPNGSNYSIRLGNASGGAQAEGASYEFTIPATSPEFSLTYYYAIVLQDPGHFSYQQPTLQFEITNVTDNQTIDCSSFSFIASGGLPGFYQSTTNTTGIPVWCKDWSANSINLDGYQGKTIRLAFRTADCVFNAHFGYAYLDVSTDCSSSFTGASFCADDTAVVVSAPFGYQNYTWFNSDFSQTLGTGQTLTFDPPPVPGSVINVELIPYAGYGCPDTLKAVLLQNLNVVADAGGDKVMCDNEPVQIGVVPLAGVAYRWSPTTGLSNPNISNPFVNATATTVYTLTARSLGGGCLRTDEVTVNKPNLSTQINLAGSASYCTNTGQSSVLSVSPADSIQWYQNGVAITGANETQYNVIESGNYNASLFSDFGCSVVTEIKRIDIYPTPVAAVAVDKNELCFPGNEFTFTNQSTIASGAMQYTWNFGDGQMSSDSDVVHGYLLPGTYNISLHVTAAGGCFSDASVSVLVKPGAAPDFTVKSTCMELPLPLMNTTYAPGAATVNYLWDFGNGQTSGLQNPVFTYPLPGTYSIKLSANTPECPDFLTRQIDVVVEAPRAAIRYADVNAIINFPEQLAARQIANKGVWSPATNLNNPNTYNPIFKGPVSQLYNITLTTTAGCITVDTLLVKTYKKIAINVPTGFTPNGDGFNDFLRPVLFGFKKVIYFRVFNRAGQVVYQMNNELPGWDGKWKGAEQSTQTYVWMIKAEDLDGVVHEEKGTTILIR